MSKESERAAKAAIARAKKAKVKRIRHTGKEEFATREDKEEFDAGMKAYWKSLKED